MPITGYSNTISVTTLAPSFDPDAQAFFDRVTTAGGTLSLTEKNATNQLVLDMKSAGIWTPMKAIYPMVGASAAACAQNLKSSSFTGSFTSGWTFASTGVTGNGTSAYMNTGFNPSLNLTTTSGHNSAYLRTNLSISGQYAYGCETTTLNRMVLFPYSFSVGWISDLYDNSQSRIISNSGNSTGFVLGSRSSSSSHKLFRNGSQIAASTNSTNGTLPNLNYYISAFNSSNTATFYNTNQLAFYSIGDGLTDTQASNFYTAVQAFQTTLSRQV
jgi:hypothetical protein